MEVVFTVMTIVLVGAAYLLFHYLCAGTAHCRRPMDEWLATYQASAPVRQREMADVLLRRSQRLAANMGVQIDLTDILANGREPAELITAWRDRLPDLIPASFLPGTPASTIGALLLVHEAEPSRFRELLGQAATGFDEPGSSHRQP